MSLGDLTRVMERATTDFTFLAQLNEKPDQALAGYDLSTEERAAILKGAIQHRLNKMHMKPAARAFQLATDSVLRVIR